MNIKLCKTFVDRGCITSIYISSKHLQHFLSAFIFVRYVIASKFEALGARKMFPCFDEPALKATFKLTLIHEDNYTVLSNMPVETSIPLTENMSKTVFEESVKMCTYLLCFAMGDFDYIERDYKGKKVRAYAAPDRIQEAEYGLNLTVKCLKFYEEYFDVPYVLPKLDSVAIPDFISIGMEHWGMITYMESEFLVDEKYVRNDYYVTKTDKLIAHEIAHQWFGNLVTMKWWNDIWLNEGITSFMNFLPLEEYYRTDKIQVMRMKYVMCAEDEMKSLPVIRNVLRNPELQSHCSSNIVYKKGRALTTLLQLILKDDFRKGISNYLKKYAFKNTESKDLWQELSNVSSMDLNIAEIMDTWTLQRGFPYIELQRNGDVLKATQRLFLENMNDSAAAQEENSPFGFIWKIPLIYKNLATGIEYTLWLNERNDTFKVTAAQNDLLKFNPGFSGYYIVKYDEDDYQRISKLLQKNHTVFSVTDRFNLLHDVFLLAKSDRLSYDTFLEFSKYLKKEKEYLPWTIFRESFIFIWNHMDGKSETVKLLKKYVRYLTADVYDEIVNSRNDTRHLQMVKDNFHCLQSLELTLHSDLVETVANLACQSENEKCIQRMNNELHSWIQRNNITVEIQFMFTIAIAHTKNDTIWDIMYERFAETNNTFDRINIINGLAAFTGRKEIMKTIDVIMQDPSLDSWLAGQTFASLRRNPAALPILWNYTKSNWESVLKRFGRKHYPIVEFCNEFKTLNDFEDFREFLKSIPQFQEYAEGHFVQKIRDAVNWTEKHDRTIQNWLRKNIA